MLNIIITIKIQAGSMIVDFVNVIKANYLFIQCKWLAFNVLRNRIFAWRTANCFRMKLSNRRGVVNTINTCAETLQQFALFSHQTVTRMSPAYSWSWFSIHTRFSRYCIVKHNKNYRYVTCSLFSSDHRDLNLPTTYHVKVNWLKIRFTRLILLVHLVFPFDTTKNENQCLIII